MSAPTLLRLAGAGLAPLLLAGCAGRQSALDPHGPSAALVHTLGIVMWIVAGLVTALVTVLMLLPFWRPARRGPALRALLIGGGVLLPAVSLTLLLLFSAGIGQEMRRDLPPGAHSVTVTGRLYWWEMQHDRGGLNPAVTANELRIPVGEPVELLLRSEDVIHSFWVPSLAGKTDMIPGRENRMVIEATREGVYRGQCAEYCGRQHALMAFDVHVMSRAAYDSWLASLVRPSPAPADPALAEGRELFGRLGCGSCHAVSGVSEGRLGPNLTNVGARASIGAGALGPGVGNIAGWISSTQHIKPGAQMPSYDQLEGRQLRLLAAWLASLK